MRQQTKNLIALVQEFKTLKEKIFNKASFVEVDSNNQDMKRYNELVRILYCGKGG